MGAPNMDALAEQVVGIPVTRREEKAEGGASEKLDLDTASTPPRRAHRRRRRKIKAKGVLLQANMLRGWFATAIFCGIRDGAPGIFCVSASAEDESNALGAASDEWDTVVPSPSPSYEDELVAENLDADDVIPAAVEVETDDDGGEEEEEEDDDDARPATPPPQAPVTATDWWGNLRQANPFALPDESDDEDEAAPRLGEEENRAYAPAEWRNSMDAQVWLRRAG